MKYPKLKWKVAALIACTSVLTVQACDDKAASTIDESHQTCQLFCTGDCSSAWTQSVPLWCKDAPSYNCGIQELNPPINMTMQYVSGHCGYQADECGCIVDLEWTDIQPVDAERTTSPCG